MISVHILVSPMGGVWRTSASILCLLAAFAPRLIGQVFQVNGGASTLYRAQGGTLSLRGPSYKLSLGAGTVDGRFVGGANFTNNGRPVDLDRRG
jgi:hypothetical protein